MTEFKDFKKLVEEQMNSEDNQRVVRVYLKDNISDEVYITLLNFLNSLEDVDCALGYRRSKIRSRF